MLTLQSGGRRKKRRLKTIILKMESSNHSHNISWKANLATQGMFLHCLQSVYAVQVTLASVVFVGTITAHNTFTLLISRSSTLAESEYLSEGE